MDNIIYRTIKKEDFSAIKEFINDAFKFNAFIQNEKILNSVLDAYLHESLLKSTFNKVVEKNGKIIGFIIAESYYDKNKGGDNKFISKVLKFKSTLRLLFMNGKTREKINEFSQIANEYEKLKSSISEKYDGSIILFVVSPESRGLGIGKNLIAQTNEYFKKVGVQKYYLYTDTRCNYGFYDSQGFVRVNEKPLMFKDSSKNMDVFMYEYKL